MAENQQPTFDAWCIVEIFGHQQIAGRVTEQTIASQGFVRIDVPAVKDQPGYTRMYGPGAIYSITPTTEEIATAFVARNVGAPIQPWQLEMARLPEKSNGRDKEYELESEGDEGISRRCPDCGETVPDRAWDTAEGKCIDCTAPF